MDVVERDCSDTMTIRNGGGGGVRSIRNRKKVKRMPSFESKKYIEHLENELGSVMERLGALQSPETVRGQAAKIRKLERKVEEFSKQISDWEKNYEERVNDEVFERIHGESDLRLKILTLEEAASHKETHVAELGKELEEAKIKLVESESVEVILGRRVDALTELLARSPTRKNFSSSDAPVVPRSVKPRAPRFSMSPTRDLQSIENVDSVLSANESMLGSPIEMFSPRHIEGTDGDSIALDALCQTISGIFDPTRPSSIHSTTTFSTVPTGDKKPVAHHRRSRRFVPGTTGLKPLLLPTTAGFHNQNSCYETPEKRRRPIQSDTGSSWESAGELSSYTPSRQKIQRPHSWTHHSTDIIMKDTFEDEESEDETFLVSNDQIGSLPAFLKCGTPESTNTTGSSMESSPAQTKLSLEQELEAEDSSMESPCDSSPFGGSQSRPEASAESTFVTLKRLQPSRATAQEISESRFGSDLRSPHDMLPSELRHSYLANLVASLRQKSLDLARQVLIRSWTRGIVQFRSPSWWILGFYSRSRKVHGRPHTPRKQDPTGNDVRSLSTSEKKVCAEPQLSHKPISIHSRSPSGQNFGLARLLLQLQTFMSSDPNGSNSNQCPHCIEPSSKRQLKLWTKLAMALILAIGYAILEGPGVVLEPDNATQQHDPEGLQAVRADDEGKHIGQQDVDMIQK